MTSLRQIEANRRNALKSTGPTSEAGKARSRRNAIRHGLTAETVVEPLEDPEDYKAFEMSITAEFDAQTAVERELVLRLASVLWRLRRSTAIETALLQMGERGEEPPAQTDAGTAAPFLLSIPGSALSGRSSGISDADMAGRKLQTDSFGGMRDPAVRSAESGNAQLARRFLRFAKFDSGGFERVNRYETALWRQAAQLLFLLNCLRRPRRLRVAFPSRRTTPFLLGSRN
jgi:hypothetical protein